MDLLARAEVELQRRIHQADWGPVRSFPPSPYSTRDFIPAHPSYKQITLYALGRGWRLRDDRAQTGGDGVIGPGSTRSNAIGGLLLSQADPSRPRPLSTQRLLRTCSQS